MNTHMHSRWWRRWLPTVAGLRYTGSDDAGGLDTKQVSAARTYIADYWPELTRRQTTDQDSLIGLPYPYLVASYEPGHDFDFNELYYWDTYMMAQGLLPDQNDRDGHDDQRQALVEGLLENLLYLFRRYAMVPNGSRTYLASRSQPPFLTSFIFEVYEAYGKDLEWLRPRMALARQEYEQVWLGTRKPHNRQVHHGLSRYYSPDMTHDQAENESGWDYTPRFQRRCLDFLPVDLNALLYKYETDFARAANLLGETAEARQWQAAARRRRRAMHKLLWDGRRGLFYDYDLAHHRRGPVSSLAAYYCLWAGVASRNQARAMVRALHRFEYAGGLTTTDDIPLAQRFAKSPPTQWAYPNGWAPLHWLVAQGLERYGYHAVARRIALSWLRTNTDWFTAHGVFLEKYNVVSPGRPPAPGVYPSQTGFGWTNAIYERLCRQYLDRRR